MPRALVRLLPLIVLFGCAGARPVAQAPAEPIHLTVIGTNDLHGWVQPHQAKLGNGSSWSWGGLASFASYVERLRAQNSGAVVLLDAGDLFQGTLVTNLSEGAVVIDTYNALGYDAVAIGNHEFDYGPVGPRSAALEPGDDPCGALEAAAKRAKFPLLGRNVYYADSGKRPPFLAPDGLAMVERKGLKIGLVGLLTPMTPQVTNPVNVSRLRFTSLAEEALSAAGELRRRGADLLVAVVHAGSRCPNLADPRSLAGCDESGEIFQMLNALPAGLFDAVLAGHTHAQIGHFINGMPVIESGAYGTQFGVIDLVVDPKTRRPLPSATRIRAALPICAQTFGSGGCEPRQWRAGVATAPATFDGAPIAPDPRIESLLAPYLARVEPEQRRTLKVEVPQPLLRDYQNESALGNALADAVRSMEKSDVALLNAGGLRSDLPAGELTYGALFEVLPFDNTVATLTLSGEEVVQLLESLLNSTHGAPQTSGLRFVVERCGRSAKITSIRFADGRPFDAKATYKLTTSDFLALGGDGTAKVVNALPPERRELGHRRPQNMRDALAAWLQQRGGTFEGRVDQRLTFSTPAACSR